MLTAARSRFVGSLLSGRSKAAMRETIVASLVRTTAMEVNSRPAPILEISIDSLLLYLKISIDNSLLPKTR